MNHKWILVNRWKSRNKIALLQLYSSWFGRFYWCKQPGLFNFETFVFFLPFLWWFQLQKFQLIETPLHQLCQNAMAKHKTKIICRKLSEHTRLWMHVENTSTFSRNWELIAGQSPKTLSFYTYQKKAHTKHTHNHYSHSRVRACEEKKMRTDFFPL